MKTLTVNESAGNLAKWLRRAVACEDIVIRANTGIVALHPLASVKMDEKLPLREALRRLQRNARLTRQDADHYLREARVERLAADKSAA